MVHDERQDVLGIVRVRLMMARYRKLTDITSSEGNLSRFSYICNGIRNIGYIDEKRLHAICGESGISHPRVIGRHIHILRTLDLVMKREGLYYVSSYGKVIASFFEWMNHLTKEEKAVYFQSFFRKVFPQLFSMLKVIDNNEKSCRSYRECFEKNVIDYFSLPEIQTIWNRKTLVDSVNEYHRSGLMRRGIENKFETMLEWLENMDLVSKNEMIALSAAGKKIYNSFLGPSFTLDDESIDRISLFILREEVRTARTAEDYDTIRSCYVESIGKFTNEEGLGDLDAVNLYSFTKLAQVHGLYLSRDMVSDILSKLQNDQIIRSFILDRKGRLSIIQVR